MRRTLYRMMLLIRMVEERIAWEYAQGEMRCPVHLSIGQEAIAAGVCANLKRADIVFSTHRCHGHYLAKGGNLKAMIAELYGKETGCSGGFGGSMRLIDLSVNFWGATPIVGNSIPLAVGTAFAARLGHKHHLGVAFFGEAATEEGVFYESVNFAVLHKLPVLFVCENNLYSVNTHIRDRQPKRSITAIAKALGVGVTWGDGNNVLEVSDIAARAIANIRRGHGPEFVEFTTYRRMVHCGIEIDLGRPKKEIEYWNKRDPLQRDRLPDREAERIKKEMTRTIDEAFAFAKKSPFPAKHNLEKAMYAN